ncbi:MAG TPA: hypothetical protein VGJ33_16145 [Candidatus Angelobacter sp.]|jgi:hypothetical protein
MKAKKNQFTSAGRQGILFVLDTMLEKEIFRQRHHHPCGTTAPRPAEEPNQFRSTHSEIRDLLTIKPNCKTVEHSASKCVINPIHCATF